MGLLSGLFGGGIKDGAEGAATLLDGIGGFAQDMRSVFTGDLSPEKKAEFENKLLTLQAEANKAQIQLNAVEATHTSIFVAGWRPFIGWVCGVSLAYSYVLHPILAWVVVVYGLDVKPPELDTSSLITIVMSLLGLGGLRTYEKTKKVSGKH
ncbi:hypothetical protein KAR91_19580 [Candidatus Pacearchaeota archaeon]|nr:hypothetical protein [Candidatus Pacearchaeota archaeon]